MPNSIVSLLSALSPSPYSGKVEKHTNLIGNLPEGDFKTKIKFGKCKSQV